MHRPQPTSSQRVTFWMQASLQAAFPSQAKAESMPSEMAHESLRRAMPSSQVAGSRQVGQPLASRSMVAAREQERVPGQWGGAQPK